MRILSDRARFAVENVDIEQAAQFPGATWEPFQIVFLNNTSRFGIWVKARQIAWSFTAALDAVIDGILTPDTTHIFVSINLDEAKEKIRYARNIIEAIPDPRWRPRLVQDSQTSLEFDNGSRLISHPCRPPRGKPRARIYYDEMAHYASGMDRETYRAGLPATVKGDGYIRIGSSPLGAHGLFWEIVTEAMRAYPGFTGHRYSIPWWHIRALCTDVARAIVEAPGMPTEERVYEFGTPVLIEIYQNMFTEDFQQEYECAWVDEAAAWIAWDTIKANQDPNLLWWRAKTVSQAYAQLPEVLRAIDQSKLEVALAGGLDIGRKRDLTVLIVVGRTTTGALPVRWLVELATTPYDDQQGIFTEIITKLPFTRVLVDQTGLGSQLAENLRGATGGIARGVDFTNPAKELWAVEARIKAERIQAPLPVYRELAYQIHSVKRLLTKTKHASFDTDRNEDHHADMFWAWALALTAGKQEFREFLAV